MVFSKYWCCLSNVSSLQPPQRFIPAASPTFHPCSLSGPVVIHGGYCLGAMMELRLWHWLIEAIYLVPGPWSSQDAAAGFQSHILKHSSYVSWYASVFSYALASHGWVDSLCKAYYAVPSIFRFMICIQKPTINGVLDDNGVPPCGRPRITNITTSMVKKYYRVHHLQVETRRLAWGYLGWDLDSSFEETLDSQITAPNRPMGCKFWRGVI